MASGTETAALVLLLCRYWRTNPLACDTADGIARWWLSARQAATPAEVDAALAALEARQLVERMVGRDGRVHFRLRHEIASHPRLLDTHLDDSSGSLQ